MGTKRDSHKLNILKRLFDSKEQLTATDFTHISNPNQYFVELESQGYIKSEWGYKGNAKVKYRFVPNDSRDKVSEYLKNHLKSNESKGGN